MKLRSGAGAVAALWLAGAVAAAGQTAGEQTVTKAASNGQTADLRGLPAGQNVLSASFLLHMMAQGQAGGKTLAIIGAEVDEAIDLTERSGALDAPAGVWLEQCHFLKRVTLAGSHFHGNLAFLRCRFDEGIDLSSVTVDGDLLVREPLVAGAPPNEAAMNLNEARVGGKMLIGAPKMAGEVAARSVTARDLTLRLGRAQVKTVDFSHLTADSTFVSGGEAAQVDTIDLSGAAVKNMLRVLQLGAKDLNLSLARVDGVMELEDIRIDGRVTAGGATFGSLRLTYSKAAKAQKWPKMEFTGMTFTSAQVVLPGAGSGGGDAPPTGYQAVLLLLHRARYSQSAYESLESELTRRGQIPQADDVFFAMHHANREAQLSWNPATWSWVAFDCFQEYVLGYGRTVLEPGLWSLIFVLIGLRAFAHKDRMTPVDGDGKPPEFSALWYSLELFLPVVDLGMAKSWRPTGRGLQTYARVHQIAGWVLVPVALAAMTGVGR